MGIDAKEYKAQLKRQYEEGGLGSLEPKQVLELTLFYAMPVNNALECANALISHYGSVNDVFNATYDSLMETEHMSENAATFIKLIPQMCIQYSKSRTEKSILDDSTRLRDFFSAQYYGVEREMVKLACIDDDLQVVHVCTIAGGEVSFAMLNAKNLVSEIIESGCIGCILAHNHPQGKCMPSNEDASLTASVRQLLHAIDVSLYDHIIVGTDGVWSMKVSRIL